MPTQNFETVNQTTQAVISALDDIAALIGEPQPETIHLNRGEEIKPGLGLISDAAALQKRSQDIKQGIFKIIVLGEFNHGKSTLVNALLGQKTLAIKALPSTAIITEVVHGHEDIVNIYELGQDKPRTLNLKDFSKEFTLTHQDRLTLQKNQYLDRFQNIEYAQLSQPAPFLANGLRLIDTPGLGEHVSRTRIAINYLKQAQAIIFVLDAIQILSQSERDFIHSFSSGHSANGNSLNHVFFVINRIDQVEDLDSLKNWVQSSLQDYFLTPEGTFDQNLYNRRVFFTNAKQALTAQLADPPDQNSYQTSGVETLNNELEQFLSSEEKLTASFQSTIEILIYILSEAKQRINRKQAAYTQPLDVLEKVQQETQEHLKQLEERKVSLVQTITQAGETIKQKIYNDLQAYIVEMERDWPEDAKKLDIKELSVFSIMETAIWQKQRTQIASAVEEAMREHLEAKIDLWIKRITKLVEPDLNTLINDLEKQISSIQLELDHISYQFSGQNFKEATANNYRTTSFITRVLSISNPGRLTENQLKRETILGFADRIFDWFYSLHFILKFIVYVLIISYLGYLILSLLVPWTLLEGVRIYKEAVSLQSILLNKLGKKLHKNLAQGVKAEKDKIEGHIENEFRKLANDISQGLQAQIDELRTEHETIIAQKKDKNFSTDQENARLGDIETILLARFNQINRLSNGIDLNWEAIEAYAQDKTVWQIADPTPTTAEPIDSSAQAINESVDKTSAKTESTTATPQPAKPKPTDISKHLQTQLAIALGLPNPNVKNYVAQNAVDYLALELADLIGLQTVKERIIELFYYFMEEKRRLQVGASEEWDKPTLHMVFTGNPGTGKTTIARIIGRTYYKLGLLRSGHTVEAQAHELISRYVGNTVHDTNIKINEALDGVLFIDEAYHLTERERISYGMESLNVILTRMDNDRHRLAIIVAGYPDKMENFMEANPGLTRRIPSENIIHFPDYSAEELHQILLKMIQEKGFVCSSEATKALQDIIKSLYLTRDEKTFGNAGEMRNLAESLIRRRAKRVGEKELSVNEPITPEDIPENYRTSSSRSGWSISGWQADSPKITEDDYFTLPEDK